MNSKQILLLYRNIVKHAKVFPSIKRDGILREIRSEFRKNKSLMDPIKVNLELQKATEGLNKLMMYVNLEKRSANWVVNLERNPIPAPPRNKE